MPAPQAPLSNQNAYTNWPGGVDPSAPLFNTDNQTGGRARQARRLSRRRRVSRKVRGGARNAKKVSRKASRKSKKSKKSRKGKKASRKAQKAKKSRKGRKASRKARSLLNRLFGKKRGGSGMCTPIDTTGSIASFPMTGSVCPEGSFEQTGRLVAQ